MTASAATPAVPQMDGTVAYPRKNGIPVFDSPWESRAFGMVVKLHTSGVFPWEEFKELLIEEVAAGSCAGAPPDSSEYYYQWVTAFCRLLERKNILSESDLNARAQAFAVGERREVY